MDWFSAPDYRLARFVIERGLGLVYLLAFLVALNQFPALLGERGLLPVPRYLARVALPARRRASSTSATPIGCSAPSRVRASSSPRPRCSAFPQAGPLWLPMLGLARPLGCCISRSSTSGSGSTRSAGSRSCSRRDSSPIFLGNARTAPRLPDPRSSSAGSPFRVELGAGLIKLRGDPLLARSHLHGLPPRDPADAEPAQLVLPPAAARGSTGLEVLGNYVAQLVAPFLLFLPQPIAGDRRAS